MRKAKALVMAVMVMGVALVMVAKPVLAGVALVDSEQTDAAGVASLRCSRPQSPAEVQRCREMEQQILAATVRVQLILWSQNEDGSYTGVVDTGHATVQDGRYLVTHNHLRVVSLSDRPEDQLVTVSVLSADGELLWEGSLDSVHVVAEEPEALVLELVGSRGERVLEDLGVASAEYLSWESVPLKPGMELAQVDWDGEVAHVDWVVVDRVAVDSGTPRLELANYAAAGSSGGGVYWNGRHVANNWYRTSDVDGSSGEVLRQYSVVALNSELVAVRSESDGSAEPLVSSEVGSASVAE